MNSFGLIHNIRYQPNLLKPDINRNYLCTTRDNYRHANLSTADVRPRGSAKVVGTDASSTIVAKYVNISDLVIDLHDGWGFHKINPESIGSSVSPSPTAVDVGATAVDAVNNTIPDPFKKFTLLTDIGRQEPEGSLLEVCTSLRIPYLLVETTGQNDVQPIDIRTRQIRTILDAVL